MTAIDEFEIIDAHVHLYRNLDLERQNVDDPGRRDRDRWGNPDAISAFMDRQGISRVLCLPNFPTRQMRESLLKAAASAGQDPEEARSRIDRELAARVRRQNAWLSEVASANPRLAVAVGVQKLLTPDEMVQEVRLRASQGARSVKMLPGFYYEYPNDRAFWDMYAECEKLGLAVTSDTGTLGQESGTCFGEPVNFTDVLESFPRLTLVMAHFPSAFWDERVELARRYANLFFDISGGFNADGLEVRDGQRALPLEDAARVLRRVGVDRFVFGSDGPRFLFQPALEQVLALELTDGDKQAILAENAKRIYRL
jgi:predicted TIM-barrel fold metal-dependent hydrolase